MSRTLKTIKDDRVVLFPARITQIRKLFESQRDLMTVLKSKSITPLQKDEIINELFKLNKERRKLTGGCKK